VWRGSPLRLGPAGGAGLLLLLLLLLLLCLLLCLLLLLLLLLLQGSQLLLLLQGSQLLLALLGQLLRQIALGLRLCQHLAVGGGVGREAALQARCPLLGRLQLGMQIEGQLCSPL
jgi:hypothetical protein